MSGIRRALSLRIAFLLVFAATAATISGANVTPAFAASKSASDVELLRAGKFAEAKQVIEASMQHDGVSAASYCNLGIALLHLRNYNKAYENLDLSLKLDPKLLPAWLNLAACNLCMGDVGKAIECYRKAESLSAPHAFDALINALQTQTHGEELSADYFVPGWRSWNHGDVIKLYVGNHPRYHGIAVKAMQDVVTATGGALKLEVVPTPTTANVICELVQPAPNQVYMERGVEAAVARNGKLAKANVQIFLSKESGLDFLSDDLVRKSCLHEFMHTLGVRGHSSNVEDVMFPLIELPTVEARLSPRDRTTLQRLYSEQSPTGESPTSVSPTSVPSNGGVN